MRWVKANIAFALVLMATASAADTLTGKVVGVMSGDTITFQSPEGKLFKVRLAEVDSPDISQAFGKQASHFTRSNVLAKNVTVKYQTVDRFHRLIGEVILADGRVLNHELVRHGLAWHYRVRYPSNEFLRELEYRAWKKRTGLWVDPSAVPPWKLRRETPTPGPPENPSLMDYDRVFDYGLIADPNTKWVRWPACRNYPERSQGFAVFGSLSDAVDSGFKISPDCTGG